MVQQEIELRCEVCGERFYRKPYRITPDSPGRFCSNECKGSHVGTSVGFGGTGRGNWTTGPKKWDYGKVYTLQDERGWGCNRISKELKIPESTVSFILHRRKECLT